MDKLSLPLCLSLLPIGSFLSSTIRHDMFSGNFPRDKILNLNEAWVVESPASLLWNGFSSIFPTNFIRGTTSKADLSEITNSEVCIVLAFFNSRRCCQKACNEPHLSLNMQIYLAAIEPQRLYLHFHMS